MIDLEYSHASTHNWWAGVHRFQGPRTFEMEFTKFSDIRD